MYRAVYVICIFAWCTGTLYGAGVPGQAEKATTSQWLSRAPQHYGSPSFRHMARGVAVLEYLAKGGLQNTDMAGPKLEQALHEVDAREKNIVHEERTRRSTTYQPYTDNPYDLGPLNQCSTPVIPRCSFSSDVTIPEYEARRIRYLFDFLDPLFDQINQLPNFDSRCVNSLLTNVLCDIAATPRCIGNDRVRYESLSEQVCRSTVSAVSSCSTQDKTLFQSLFCSPTYLSDFEWATGDFSLTQCSTPNIDTCDSSGTSPEWLVVQYENEFRQTSSNPVTVANGLTGTCKTDYLRVSCTIPTCTSDNRLQGTLTFDQCNRVLECVLDPATREALGSSPSLLCESYKTIRSPSGSSSGLTVSFNIAALVSSVVIRMFFV